MRLVETKLPPVSIIELDCFGDERGEFVPAWDRDLWAEHGIGPFVQGNVSRSGPAVLRGLHFQRTQPQGKLLQVMAGAIFDVAVDIRPDSSTRGQWVGVHLDAAEPRQIWVPPGFAHGFCVIRAPVVVHYLCTTPYAPNDQGGIRWDDPDLAIDWPLDAPVLSERDQAMPLFRDVLGGG